jgi:hypothetical protein
MSDVRNTLQWENLQRIFYGNACVYFERRGRSIKSKNQNHGTQDSRVVPHRGTNWAALWLTSQIGRDAVLSESYGRGCNLYS